MTIALQCCDIWFKRKLNDTLSAEISAAGLVDLQHQIDPTNPQYIKVYRTSLKQADEMYQRLHKGRGHSPVSFYVDGFCRYLLPFDSLREVEMELMSLVSLLFKYALDYFPDDARSLFEEIDAVLAEAGLSPSHDFAQRQLVRSYRSHTICS